MNPATKVMAGLLVRVHTGFVKVKSKGEEKMINRLAKLLDGFREKALLSFKDRNVDLKDERVKVAEEIYSAIEDAGPITEVPFLPHTEELGKCSVFYRSFFVDSDVTSGDDFEKCLEFLGGVSPSSEGKEEGWRKAGRTAAGREKKEKMKEKEKWADGPSKERKKERKREGRKKERVEWGNKIGKNKLKINKSIRRVLL